MATSIGPLYAILASAPKEWNELATAVDDKRAVIQSSQGQAFSVELYSKALHQKLFSQASASSGESWIFLAQVIREDGEALFAFENAIERALFIELREINSIGSKYAATAVLELGAEGLCRMFESGTLVRGKVPGLGPKTLDKIKSGMKDRKARFAKIFSLLRKQPGIDLPEASTGAQALPEDVPNLILQALGKLGIRPDESARIYQILKSEDPGFEKLEIGAAIKVMLARWGQSKNTRKATLTESTP